MQFPIAEHEQQLMIKFDKCQNLLAVACAMRQRAGHGHSLSVSRCELNMFAAALFLVHQDVTKEIIIDDNCMIFVLCLRTYANPGALGEDNRMQHPVALSIALML